MGLGCFETGVVGSNPTQGMDICPRFSVSCSVARGLSTGVSPVEGVMSNVELRRPRPNLGCIAIGWMDGPSILYLLTQDKVDDSICVGIL
jgi:hypothetical protein